jgi:hypothetical protein
MGFNCYEEKALSRSSNVSYPIVLSGNATQIHGVKLRYKSSSIFARPSVYVQKVTLTLTFLPIPFIPKETRRYCSAGISAKLKSEQWVVFSIPCRY